MVTHKPILRKKIVGFIKKHAKHTAILLVGGVSLFVIGAQLLYPSDQVVLYARVSGKSVGAMNREMIAADIQNRFQDSTITFRADTSKVEYKLSKLGGAIDADSVASRVAQYPLWMRFVPFSIVWYRPDIAMVEVKFDQNTLVEKSKEIAAALSTQPSDATLEIKDGKLIATKAQSGSRVGERDIRDTVKNAGYALGVTELPVKAAVIKPSYSDTDIAPVRAQAEAATGRHIIITLPDGMQAVPTSVELASLLSISKVEGRLVLGISDEALNGYIEMLNKQVYQAPEAGKVVYVDGEAAEQRDGKPGSELNKGLLAERMRSVMFSEESQAAIATETQPVYAGDAIERRYTSSEKGLRAYVQHITSTRNIRIAVKQLNGSGWTATGRAHESIPSASTYKLFVMLEVFNRINDGRLRWNDGMLDTTVATCFERTIVPSTNPCAEQWIRDFGRDYLDEMVRSKGFSSGTGFNFSDANHTTAADLMKYVEGLYLGTLVTGNNRDLLLEKMSRQLYRYGVPTGSKGRVWDKVGFLWNYVHDAAIVEHPRGTYVVAIMTGEGSYAPIAEVTRKIESIMYP